LRPVRLLQFILFSHLFIVLVPVSLPPLPEPPLLPIPHVHVPHPARMTSHAPPRLSSHSSNQSWRKVDEKPTYLSSLSSTLKMGSTRGWLASNPRGTIPMHHHQKSGSDTLEWKGSPQRQGLLTNLRRAMRSALRSSDALPNFTSTSRRAGGLSGRPTPTSITSPHLFTIPSLSTLRFMFLCGLWYASSALSSNTGKAILNQFRYPITLTFVQFGFVAAYCMLFMSPIIRFSRMRRPTRAILKDTLPMGFFQVGGHIFSSMAISRIPVSTTHTIKVSAHQRPSPSD
jgi:Triose-phosphate Transporter family